MMKRVKGNCNVWALLSILFVAVGPALSLEGPNAGLRRCTKTVEVTSCNSSTGECTTGTNITSVPAILCSVQLIATSANAWVEVFSSPDDTEPGSDTEIVAEPGVATAGNSVNHYFGEAGILTNESLNAIVVGGRAIIHYDD